MKLFFNILFCLAWTFIVLLICACIFVSPLILIALTGNLFWFLIYIALALIIFEILFGERF